MGFSFADILQRAVLYLPVLLLSLTVHEFAHAWAARRLGDDTAERMGRLTLNPLAHADPLGTFLLPLLIAPFGWAKPVPVNPARFRPGVDMGRGMMFTSLAGPAANVAPRHPVAPSSSGCSSGSRPTGSQRVGRPRRASSQIAIQMNVVLAVFNLIPIPPLDGSRIVDAFLPARFRPAVGGLRAVLAVPPPRARLLRLAHHRRAGRGRHPAPRAPARRHRLTRPHSMTDPKLPIVVSGMRPTGRLHLGHLHGALANWVKLQETTRAHFFSADWHALTTSYHETDKLKQAEFEMFVDFLAAGIDPAKTVLFIQSQVKEHAELFLLLGMITPIGWLERSPSYKEMREQITDRDLSLYGFLGYPVLMAADIILYKATLVPVGADQVTHLELTREIARQVQLPLRRGLPRAEAAPHRGGQGGGHRRPQDVEELRQRHRPRARRPSRPRRSHGRRHRPGPQAPQGPGQPRGLRHLLPAPDLQRPGDRRLGRTRLPHGRDRLRRLQEEAARAARARPGAAPRAAGEAPGPARTTSGTWCSYGTARARAVAAADHGPGPRRDEPRPEPAGLARARSR